jgi:radical SAM superfamily enzyme YgiQ (UPF0313 family)
MKPLFYPAQMQFAPPLPTTPVAPPRKKYVLLINPFYAKDPHGSFGKHVLTPTLALSSLARVIPDGWQVLYWDENLLQGSPPCDPFPQVVGITVHLTFAKRAYALSDWYRRRGALVIMGGLHVQSCPDEAAANADAIVRGNGLQVWHRVLKDVEKNCLKRVYQGSYHSDYAGEPPPLRTILEKRQFLTTAGLIATRGCRNRCDFCYLSTSGLRMPKRFRSPAQVAREFQNSGQPYGVFLDNNLGSDEAYLKSLCRALKPLKKIWSAAISVNVARNPSLVREMGLSGCTGVFVGLETLNQSNLEAMHKSGTVTDTYADGIKVFHNAGIQVNGSFVFGFDHDRRDVFERTIQWIESVRLECATFHILTPYPDTPLFRTLNAHNRLLHRNWSLYDTAHAVFEPAHMSPEELEAGYAWCYRKLFSMSSIWRRRPSHPSAVIPYFLMSVLYKNRTACGTSSLNTG